MRWIAALLGLAILFVGLWLLIDGRGVEPTPAESARAAVPDRQPVALADERAPVETPVPAAAVEETEVAPPRDPTAAEIEPFRLPSPPGTIEGIVLKGAVPAGGGRAWLGEESKGGLPWGSWELWDAALHVSRTEIGADGTFRFEGVGLGEYAVGVRTADGLTRHVHVSAESTERLVIVFGVGGIRGHVYDENGEPCRSWEVAVAGPAQDLGGLQLVDRAQTDALGEYEVASLVGGTRYVVQTSRTGNVRDPDARTQFVDLPPSHWTTVDFGAPAGEFVWTGRLLLPRGAPLEVADTVELVIRNGGRERRATVASDGGFQVRLPAGKYAVEMFFYSTTPVARTSAALGAIEVADRNLDRDLTVPTAMVHVRARYRGTREDAADVLRSLRVRLAENSSAPDRAGSVAQAGLRGADGTQYLLGVPPGEHALSCSHPIRGAPGGVLPVRVTASDREIELDVVVEDW
jgi:hypothetical protein